MKANPPDNYKSLKVKRPARFTFICNFFDIANNQKRIMIASYNTQYAQIQGENLAKLFGWFLIDVKKRKKLSLHARR
jgi:hypothetical protein